ncbi:MAG: hypothetical protein L3J79_04645 [Candidatus Marinimicrobia bacterium]|nr:hypothetical protein [Candidatus Neomarinimicrobiota bacterium]
MATIFTLISLMICEIPAMVATFSLIYTKILKDTLEMLKEVQGGQVASFPVPDMTIDVEMQIPASYIEDTPERIALYRRIAASTDIDTLYSLRAELRERFGRLPDPVENLLDRALIKALGQSLGIRSVLVKARRIQTDFLPEHVEHAGGKIIKGLARALVETGQNVEIMNNRTLTLVMTHQGSEKSLSSLRIFLESLLLHSKFFEHDHKT